MDDGKAPSSEAPHFPLALCSSRTEDLRALDIESKGQMKSEGDRKADGAHSCKLSDINTTSSVLASWDLGASSLGRLSDTHI